MKKPFEGTFQFEPIDSAAQQLLAVSLSLMDHDLGNGHWQIDIPKTIFESLEPEDFKRFFSDLILERSICSSKIEVRITGDSVFRVTLKPHQG